MRFPRQFNALQAAYILGPRCFDSLTIESVSDAVVDFFAQRGGFSYDPTRRHIAGLLSGHVLLERVLSEVARSGQPLGRKWNIELVQTIHSEYGRRAYRFRPIKLSFRPIVEGLVLRIPCNFFIVEDGEVILQVLQLSRAFDRRLSEHQIRFVLSSTQHTLAKDDLARATSQLGDLSKKDRKGLREPTWTSLASIGCATRDELNSVLTMLKDGYAHAIENRRLPANAYRPPRGWEEDQYRLL
jgi:hypothetical protein